MLPSEQYCHSTVLLIHSKKFPFAGVSADLASSTAFKPTPAPPPPPTIPPLSETADPSQQSLLKSSQAATPLSVRLNINGGLGSPERSLKRGSSIDEYEAGLDRGRTKKAKKYREPQDSQSSLSSTTGYNPFQSYQNRSSSSGNGGDRQRSYSDSRSASFNRSPYNGGSSGNGYSWQQQPQQQHRDHSYHSNNSYNRGEYDNHNNSAVARRSYSSSAGRSESDHYSYRDQRHSGFNKRRDSSDYGGRGGRSGGRQAGAYYDRDNRGYRDYKR